MRVGVLGMGSIGKRHAFNLIDLGQKVCAYDPCVDDDWKRRQSNLEKRAEMIDYVSREDVLRSDALVIATPTYHHYFDLIFCMATGKPTFVEKPIAGTHSQWCGLQNYESATKLFVGYNLRFHKCVIQAKKWLGGGRIGTPLWASFTCAQFNDKPAYLRDGVIFNWSHEIDLALNLLGPAKVACAAAHTTEGNDDIADIVLQHANAVQSHIHLDYRTRPQLRGSVIVGTKALIIVDLALRHAWLRDTGGHVLEHFEAHDSFDSNYVDEMAAFIGRIEGKDVPGATGDDGLAALDICLQARRMAGLQ